MSLRFSLREATNFRVPGGFLVEEDVTVGAKTAGIDTSGFKAVGVEVVDVKVRFSGLLIDLNCAEEKQDVATIFRRLAAWGLEFATLTTGKRSQYDSVFDCSPFKRKMAAPVGTFPAVFRTQKRTNAARSSVVALSFFTIENDCGFF